MWQRWNQSTHIFEKSDDNGQVWVPLPLSGSIITEGTIADARLSANVPLKSSGTWTPTIVSTGGGAPTYTLQLGWYTKNGDDVTAYYNILLATLGTLGAGFIRVEGLPLPVANLDPSYAPMSTVFFSGMASNFSNIINIVRPNVAYAEFAGIGAAGPSMGGVTVANLAAGSNLVGTIIYKA